MNHLVAELIANEFELTKTELSQLSWRDWIEGLKPDDLEQLQGSLMKCFGKEVIENKHNGAMIYVLRYLSKLESNFSDWLDKSPLQLIDYVIALHSMAQRNAEGKWYWSKMHQQLWAFRNYSQGDDIPPIIGVIPFVSNSLDTFLIKYSESLDNFFSNALNNPEDKERLIAHILSSRQCLGNKTIFDDKLNLLRNPESFRIYGPISSTIAPSNLNSKSEQFCHTQISKEPTGESELVIGLDFGTSCTKAVVRDSSSQVAYAVPFKGFEKNNQLYLISTKLFIDHDDVCSLQQGGKEINDIKILLMDNPDTIIFNNNMTGDKVTALETAVAYVALVLREIRCWFFESHSNKYQKNNLLWQLNIGLPSRSYDDKSIHETFKLVALAGWNVSTQSKNISIDIVRQVLIATRCDLNLLAQNNFNPISACKIHPENVNAFPEVISEIVGYAKSPLRREGLHLLIDIGASTVDIATFILYTESGDDLFSLLTTEVEPYGAFMLHRHRLQKINDIVVDRWIHLTHLVDGMTALPKLNEFMPSTEELNSNSIDDQFIQKLKRLVKCVVVTTRKSRDPSSQHWDEGLSVFLCGGGSQLEVYKDAIKICSDILTNTLHIADFDFKKIPKPEGLEAPGLLAENYHRVAVAYGLSHDPDNIGKVVAPSQIGDIYRQEISIDYAQNYIGAENT